MQVEQAAAISEAVVGGTDEVPSFICPLTLEPMSDPVTAADGHSYERISIEKWLKKSNISPLTGKALSSKVSDRTHTMHLPSRLLRQGFR